MKKKKPVLSYSNEEFVRNSVTAILKVISTSVNKLKLPDHEKNLIMTTIFLSTIMTMIKSKIQQECWSEAFSGISEIFKKESETWKI